MQAIDSMSEEEGCETAVSSLKVDNPNQIEELTNRFDSILDQIDALESRITGLLQEISSENQAKRGHSGDPR